MKKLFLLLTAVGMLFTACESGIEGEAPVFVVEGEEDIVGSENGVVVDNKGGEIVLKVSTNIEYKIAIPAEAESWISVTETRAVEDVSLTIVVEENDSFESRSATVQILDSEDKELFGVTISQEGADKVFVVKGLEDIVDDENGVVVDNKGGEIVLEVSTNIEYTINIPAEAESWISVTDTRAVEDASLTIVVAENDSFESRSATVQFLDGENNELFGVTISQNGIDKQDAIQFQDPEVKRICVENWDTDEDGELSYSEASTVTDLGSLFSNSSISTFDELKYFTSLGSIADNTFQNCPSLTNVTIPDSVTEIREMAFSGCTSLASVNIPQSVTTFGSMVFEGCTSLPVENNIRYADTYVVEAVDKTLSSYTLKENVRFIGDMAFNGCSSLTSITIPNGIIKIGSSAFGGCTLLTSITIPDSVTEIRENVFFGCTALESVTIPDSVTKINRGTFYYCTSLKNVTIPDSITTIEGAAFYWCSSLANITIPNNVTKIGDSAFQQCSALASITIPENVTKIESQTFSRCYSLTSITIPDSVTEIGEYAFAYCSSLTSIYCKATTPPTAVFNSSWNAFYDNVSDRKIYVPTASVDTYKAAEGWKDYAADIAGYDFE